MYKSLAAVAVVVAVGWAQSFHTITDNFATSVSSAWGSPLPAGVTWDATNTHTADGSGSMKVTGAAAISLTMYSGPGFQRTPSYVSFWMKGDLNAALEIHIDVAQSGANGVCGWWNYIGQINLVSSLFSTDWEQQVDIQTPDWGGEALTWGGTVRSAVQNWVTTNACAITNNLDTNRITNVLIWRINITGASGTVWIDDWQQGTGTPVSVQQPQRAPQLSIPSTQDFVGQRVYLPNGQIASATVGSRNLPAGCYLVRSKTGTQKLMVR